MKNIKKALVLTAVYFEKQLSDAQLEVYAKELSAYDENLILMALRAYRTSSNSKGFPLPSKIIEIASGEGSDETKATILAGEIIVALSQGRECMDKLDDIAKQAVRSFGGWRALAATTETSLPYVHSRLQAICKALLDKKSLDNLPPGRQETYISNR